MTLKQQRDSSPSTELLDFSLITHLYQARLAIVSYWVRNKIGYKKRILTSYPI